LPKFQHNQRAGAFRRWLRTILVHRLRGFWRARQSRPLPGGEGDLGKILEQLEDPQSGLSCLWDQQHDRHVMARLLEQIQSQVAPSTWEAFRRVVLPTLLPALLTGFAMAFARALGEYGSVVFISGNMPMKTEIASLLIIAKLEQYDYAGATAIAAIMLLFSFSILLGINLSQHWRRRRIAPALP